MLRLPCLSTLSGKLGSRGSTSASGASEHLACGLQDLLHAGPHAVQGTAGEGIVARPSQVPLDRREAAAQALGNALERVVRVRGPHPDDLVRVDLAIGRHDAGEGVEVLGLHADPEAGSNGLALCRGGPGDVPCHIVFDDGAVQASFQQRAAHAGLVCLTDQAGLEVALFGGGGRGLVLEEGVLEDGCKRDAGLGRGDGTGLECHVFRCNFQVRDERVNFPCDAVMAMWVPVGMVVCAAHPKTVSIDNGGKSPAGVRNTQITCVGLLMEAEYPYSTSRGILLELWNKVSAIPVPQ